MLWSLLGVAIAVLGWLIFLAAIRVIITALGGALRLVFGIFSIFDHNDKFWNK